MSKKAFVVILVLSVAVTYLTPALQILISGLSFIGKDRGLPFNFVRYSFSGYSTYTVGFFVLDVIFWFVIIFFIWKVLLRISKK